MDNKKRSIRIAVNNVNEILTNRGAHGVASLASPVTSTKFVLLSIPRTNTAWPASAPSASKTVMGRMLTDTLLTNLIIWKGKVFSSAAKFKDGCVIRQGRKFREFLNSVRNIAIKVVLACRNELLEAGLHKQGEQY